MTSHGSHPLETFTWRPNPQQLRKRPAPSRSLQQADSRLHVIPHLCRVPSCKAAGNTRQNLPENSSSLSEGRLTPVTSLLKPMGDEVPAPWVLLGHRKRRWEQWDMQPPPLVAHLLVHAPSQAGTGRCHWPNGMTELGRSQWPARLVLWFQLKLLRPGYAGSWPRTWLRGAMAQGHG